MRTPSVRGLPRAAVRRPQCAPGVLVVSPFAQQDQCTHWGPGPRLHTTVRTRPFAGCAVAPFVLPWPGSPPKPEVVPLPELPEGARQTRDLNLLPLSPEGAAGKGRQFSGLVRGTGKYHTILCMLYYDLYIIL